jgi:hypothetical protein
MASSSSEGPGILPFPIKNHRLSIQVAYKITLHSVWSPHNSPHQTRFTTLNPGDNLVLGRVSKNKPGFQPAMDNGYFDNPIVSRYHAVLSNQDSKVFLRD